MAENLNGTVGFQCVGRIGASICQIEIPCSTGTPFDNGQIGGVAFDGENHAAGSEMDGYIGMGGALVQKLRQFFHGGFGSFGLCSCKFANGSEECGINCSRIK